jgi:hypothetical protein
MKEIISFENKKMFPWRLHPYIVRIELPIIGILEKNLKIYKNKK